MAEKWDLKRFTRADVLVVAVVILLVAGLLPGVFCSIRTQSIRTSCGSKLGQIGKAMLAYANDYEGAFPRAGGPTTVWGPTSHWMAADRYMVYGLAANGSGGSATISSSFYLLVKYYQVPTKSFVCRGDEGTTEFRLSDLQGLPTTFGLMDAWDFGPLSEAFKHCSYAYHIPYGFYFLTTSRDPNMAVAADRNPYLKSPAAYPVSLAEFRPDLDSYRGTEEQARMGNALAHRREGQNVLFLDGRVTFAPRAYCAVEKDNIYLRSRYPDRGDPTGNLPAPGIQPSNEKDSMLVHDPDVFGYSRAPFPQVSPAPSAVSPNASSSGGAPEACLREPRTVGNVCVIEDFEGYTSDEGNRIYETWTDGWTNNTGSTVGYTEIPFAEDTIVHGGRQSMPFEYDNDNSPFYSEVQASWRTPVNLMADGFDVLTLYVEGRRENRPARLYVGLEDARGRSGIVAHPDARIVNRTSWVEWRIPLSTFGEAGVDITHAVKLCLGAGDRRNPSPGGAGVLYIDDIQLTKSPPPTASQNSR